MYTQSPRPSHANCRDDNTSHFDSPSSSDNEPHKANYCGERIRKTRPLLAVFLLAPHTSGPRDVPRCGALSLLQKTPHYRGDPVKTAARLNVKLCDLRGRCHTQDFYSGGTRNTSAADSSSRAPTRARQRPRFILGWPW